MKAKAKALETEAMILTKEAKGVLLPIMAAYDLKTYGVRGVGTINAKISKGSSINKGKLSEQLLIFGMEPDAIPVIIEESSSTWETEYVEFKAES